MTRQEEEERERIRRALITAGGITGLLGAVTGARLYGLDAKEQQFKKSNSWQGFKDKIKTGDVLLSRTPRWDQGSTLLLNAIKGDTHYHSAVVTPGKHALQALGPGENAARTKLKSPEYHSSDYVAYRPKSEVSKNKAIDFARKIPPLKIPYPDEKNLVQHGLMSLAGIPRKASGKACDVRKGGTCTEITANAYPKEMKNALQSTHDIKRNKNFELVARYNPVGKVPLRSKIAAYGIYPVLKNLKYGAMAGAGGYLAALGLDKLNEKTGRA